MTAWILVRIMFARWQIVIVAAVLTASVGIFATSDSGSYFTRTVLVFLAPTSQNYPNAVATHSEDVIDTAGAVAKRVAGPQRVAKYASPEVTLIGVGVRDGWSLRLPDTGGQWAPNYATQSLVLEIVADSHDAVRARQQELIAAVENDLYQLQRDRGVDPVNDISVLAAPASTVIYHVAGSRPRVLAMTGIIGVCLLIALLCELERRRRRAELMHTEPAAA